MIKAVIFDIDGVLLDSKDANCLFFQNLLESAGYRRPSTEEVSHVFHLTMLDALRFLTGDTEENVRLLWERGHSFPFSRELLRVPKGAPTVLRELKTTYKIAIATGRIRRGIPTLCEMYGVPEKFFDVVVTFENFTKPKPDSESLLVAVQRLTIAPRDAVYIGDQETDRRAAASAGMHFLFYSADNDRIDPFSALPAAICALDRQKAC